MVAAIQENVGNRIRKKMPLHQITENFSRILYRSIAKSIFSTDGRYTILGRRSEVCWHLVLARWQNALQLYELATRWTGWLLWSRCKLRPGKLFHWTWRMGGCWMWWAPSSQSGLRLQAESLRIRKPPKSPQLGPLNSSRITRRQEPPQRISGQPKINNLKCAS